MRILFVTPYVPSPIRVRSFNLIKQLSTRHEVAVVTLMQSDLERRQAVELKEHCAEVYGVFMPRRQSLLNCLRALPSPVPMQAAYCYSKAMERVIGKLANENEQGFDLLHVEHMRAARYGWGLSGIPRVYDAVDSISLLLERTMRQNPRLSHRLVGLLEMGKTRRYERYSLCHYPKVLVTAPVDRQALLHLQPAADIEVLTIGVDTEYFRPLTAPREDKQLVFSGKMSYHANAEAVLYFCQRILPLIWSRDPAVKLNIVGANPPREISALARDGRIAVTGYVEDIRPFLARATVSVCPMVYGVGVQIKVLEAMAMGTPVVATSQAVSALGVQAGRQAMIADEAEDFAASVLQLLGSETLRTRLAAEGRVYIEEQHNWRRIGSELEAVYEEVMARWREQNIGSIRGMGGYRPALTGPRSW